MRQLQHRNVVVCLDSFLVRDKLFIVMEFLPQTLLQVLESHAGGLPNHKIRVVMYQLCKVMAFIHEQVWRSPPISPPLALRLVPPTPILAPPAPPPPIAEHRLPRHQAGELPRELHRCPSQRGAGTQAVRLWLRAAAACGRRQGDHHGLRRHALVSRARAAVRSHLHRARRHAHAPALRQARRLLGDRLPHGECWGYG